MTDTQKFTGIDVAKWGRIVAQVQTKVGITITSDIGDAAAKGIELSWSFNRQTGDLAITLVKRSWFDPSEQVIDDDIKTWIQAA